MSAPSAGVVYALANELSISLDCLFGKEIADSHDGSDDSGTTHTDRSVDGPATAAPTTAVEPWGRAGGPDGSGILLRAGQRRVINLDGGVRWERLTPQHDDRVELPEVIYAPLGHSTDEEKFVQHDGREYLLVLEGSIEADVGFETHRLDVGDSMALDPGTPHKYRNPGDAVVRCLSIIVH